MATIGSCSLCGGPVTVPSLWMGVVAPVPRCAECRAIAAPSFGVVIPMQPAPVPPPSPSSLGDLIAGHGSFKRLRATFSAAR